MPLGLLAGQMLMNGANTGVSQGLNVLNYNRQRRDALSDYNRDVEYNSPKNQVKRLQEANISPYASSGQSLLATSPSTRSSSFQGNSSRAVDYQQSQLGIEQIKLLRLQQQKTQAETDSVNADVQNKTLDYQSNSQDYHGGGSLLLKKRMFEIERLLADTNNLRQSAQFKMEQTDNEVVKRAGLRSANALADIEKMYRSQLLQSRDDLMRGQLSGILLKNYEQDVKNHFSRQNEGNKASYLRSEAALKQQEAELANVLPASVRYFLEKMGGNSAIGGTVSKLSSLMLRKLLLR